MQIKYRFLQIYAVIFRFSLFCMMLASDAVDAYIAVKLLAGMFGSCHSMHLSRLQLLHF